MANAEIDVRVVVGEPLMRLSLPVVLSCQVRISPRGRKGDLLMVIGGSPRELIKQISYEVYKRLMPPEKRRVTVRTASECPQAAKFAELLRGEIDSLPLTPFVASAS